MADFANLEDGGRRLGALLVDLWRDEPQAVLVPVLPNGVPVARGIDAALAEAGIATVPWHPLPAERSADGVRIATPGSVAGRTLVVVDDGVETGTVARAAASALRAGEPARLVLAVPVCPREATADLQLRYDAIVAVARPMARRDLAWHYATFDTIDDEAAARLLVERGVDPATD